MARTQNPNIEILQMTIAKLGDLADDFVFVGGCAAGLLITDPAAPPIRATTDVDAIVDVTSRSDYYRLSKSLREKGFREDTNEGAPLCRWRSEPLILDVMPTDDRILGFGNPWYAAAIRNASITQIGTGKSFKLISPPYFMVTKLDAFENRGHGDFQMSHDMEDIIAVVDGRQELLAELQSAEIELRRSIASRVKRLLENGNFIQSVSGHLPGDQASQQRVPRVLQVLGKIADLEIS